MCYEKKKYLSMSDTVSIVPSSAEYLESVKRITRYIYVPKSNSLYYEMISRILM